MDHSQKILDLFVRIQALTPAEQRTLMQYVNAGLKTHVDFSDDGHSVMDFCLQRGCGCVYTLKHAGDEEEVSKICQTQLFMFCHDWKGDKGLWHIVAQLLRDIDVRSNRIHVNQRGGFAIVSFDTHELAVDAQKKIQKHNDPDIIVNFNRGIKNKDR